MHFLLQGALVNERITLGKETEEFHAAADATEYLSHTSYSTHYFMNLGP
jgi:hypothetical protein